MKCGAKLKQQRPPRLNQLALQAPRQQLRPRNPRQNVRQCPEQHLQIRSIPSEDKLNVIVHPVSCVLFVMRYAIFVR